MSFEGMIIFLFFSLITLKRKTVNLYFNIIKIAQNIEEAFRGERILY